jgi:hypothetical protein
MSAPVHTFKLQASIPGQTLEFRNYTVTVDHKTKVQQDMRVCAALLRIHQGQHRHPEQPSRKVSKMFLTSCQAHRTNPATRPRPESSSAPPVLRFMAPFVGDALGLEVPEDELLGDDDVPVEEVPFDEVELVEFVAMAACWNISNVLFSVGLTAKTIP